MSEQRRTESSAQRPELPSGEHKRISAEIPVQQGDEELDLKPEQQQRIAMLFSQLKQLNLYDLLGVPRTADKKTIKRAYNERMLELHPDRFFRKRLGPYKAKMEAVVARMTDAHEVLCSPERRAQYDDALIGARATLIEQMLEEAAAEMAGDSAAALREEFDMDGIVEVRSIAPPTDSDEPPRAAIATPVAPVAPRPASASQAELEARRRTLARKLSPMGVPAVRPPPLPSKKPPR